MNGKSTKAKSGKTPIAKNRTITFQPSDSVRKWLKRECKGKARGFMTFLLNRELGRVSILK